VETLDGLVQRLENMLLNRYGSLVHTKRENPPLVARAMPDLVGTVGTLRYSAGFAVPTGVEGGRNGRNTPPFRPAGRNSKIIAEPTLDSGSEIWLKKAPDEHGATIMASAGIAPADNFSRSAPPDCSDRPDPESWTTGITRLQHMPPLPGFPGRRWDQIRRDCAQLLADWGDEAHRLGWSVTDLFGVHPKVPQRGYQCMGLGVILGGGTITELNETRAMIRCRSGVIQSFTRMPACGAVPMWAWGEPPPPNRTANPAVLDAARACWRNCRRWQETRQPTERRTEV
jgi:hypothetical protein